MYESLGDVRSLLVGRVNLALLLLQRDGREAAVEANRLLCLALQAAHELQIPEMQVIESLLDKFEMQCG